MTGAPDQRELDLAECEREPIHIPAAIQPHGLLLVASAAAPHLVLQVSGNVEALLGLPVEAWLGRELVEVLSAIAAPGEPVAVGMARAIRAASTNPCHAGLLELAGRRWDVLVHSLPGDDAGVLFVELEAAVERDAAARLDEQTQLRALLAGIVGAESAAELRGLLPGALRRLTGYERVMVYLFDECGAGEVVAEERAADLEPYLGLRFPASDIPAQARRLYVAERSRLIVDAGYEPAPLIPGLRPDTGGPLDLTHAVLRSVSPIHREYLGNMGVRASMSISLVSPGAHTDGDALFGLIACHHRQPHRPAYSLRTDCACIGAVAAFVDRALVRDQANAAVSRGAHRVHRLVASIDANLPSRPGSSTGVLARLAGEDGDVLDLIDASGAVIRYQGAIQTVGRVPPAALLGGLADHCATHMVDGVYTTHALTRAYPPIAEHRDAACGVLAIAIDAADGLVAWLRPEVLRTVDWGGDPNAVVARGAEGRLSPRRSFALWREQVTGQALPFTPWEREIAEHLRHQLAEVVLRRANEVDRLNRELQAALTARDDFLSIASHELKTPLSTLLLTIEALELGLVGGEPPPPPAPSGTAPDPHVLRRLDMARRQIQRLDRLVMGLLDVSRIQSGRLELELHDDDLAAAIREVVERFTVGGGGIKATGPRKLTARFDRLRIDQVVTNLLANAVKYAGGGPVEVELSGSPRRVRLLVRDHGPGIPDAIKGTLFERYVRAPGAAGGDGLGLGLWICRAIVRAHGGEIGVEDTPGGGTTMVVELPRAGPPAFRAQEGAA